MFANLTSTQARCTELLEEVRTLRGARPDGFVTDLWNEVERLKRDRKDRIAANRALRDQIKELKYTLKKELQAHPAKPSLHEDLP